MPPERRPADTQLLRGGGLIAVQGVQRLENGRPDDFLQSLGDEILRRMRGGPAERPLSSEELRHRAPLNIGGIRQGNQRLENLFEFGIVVGPVIAGEKIGGPGIKADDLLAQLRVEIVEVDAGQEGNLINAASQGGEVQRQTAQAGSNEPGRVRQRRALQTAAGENQADISGYVGLLCYGQYCSGRSSRCWK